LRNHLLQKLALPDQLRNLYAGQEATVRIGYRTTDWFQIGKGVREILRSKFLIYKKLLIL